MKKLIWISLFGAVWLLHAAMAFTQSSLHMGPSVDFSKGNLQVSQDGRSLVFEDGSPFFYLGDTGWELFHRLTLEEAEMYLENRRSKGFTVIQAVALAELDGLSTPNRNGHIPLINNDPERPNEEYFLHLDKVIKMAESKGLYIGLLPTWGDKVQRNWGVGPVIFNEANAAVYGRWIGNRYKDFPNIIWIIGGDRDCIGYEGVWRSLARAIKSADPHHLMTYHPIGSKSSSECFHSDDWLDFNMHQSGHSERFIPNYRKIAADFSLSPVKPCMDGEPIYEDHPFNWNPEYGIAGEEDVRRAAYWALFSGAFGHTYGCHPVWQFYSVMVDPVNFPPHEWKEAMDLPGAFDMLHVRRLMESRPILGRVPDQSIIYSETGGMTSRILGTRGKGYVMIYMPSNILVTLDFSRIEGDEHHAWWYNPRTGESSFIEAFRNPASAGGKFKDFRVPVSGIDWILVVDDAAMRFEPPGMITGR